MARTACTPASASSGASGTGCPATTPFQTDTASEPALSHEASTTSGGGSASSRIRRASLVPASRDDLARVPLQIQHRPVPDQSSVTDQIEDVDPTAKPLD
jgi:hypothetical protein